MNILIVTQYFYPESFRINDFAIGLKDLGHEVSILTGFPNYPEGKIYQGYEGQKRTRDSYEGIKIYRAPIFPRGKNSKVRLLLNYLSFIFSASYIGAKYCREKYDHILVYAPSPPSVAIPAIVLKWMHKIPVYIWVQDLWPESLSAVNAVQSSFLLKLVSFFVKAIYKNSDILLVQSKKFKENIVSLGVSQNKIFYFPNSVEDFYRNPKALDISVDDLPDGFKVIFAGNIGKAQSFETIIEAAKILKNYPEIKLIIIGDGSLKDWVISEVEKNKLNETVIFISKKPPEHMPHYFMKADALLVSLNKNPAFSLTIPSKVQSYLASAKPIIASIDGETAELINQYEVGFTSPAEDHELLAKNIIKLFELSPGERNRLGENASRCYLENFERNRLLKKFVNWLSNGWSLE